MRRATRRPSRYYVYFGLFEHDVEKDVLPYLLPLRVPVLTRRSGAPLWSYLRRLGVDVSYDVIAEIKRASVETLGVDTPRVDYLRVGVSIELKPPVEEYGGFRISALAWQLAEKAKHKIVEPVRRRKIDHDVLKAVLDLRAIWAAPKETAVGYFDRSLKAQFAETLPQVISAVGEYWTSHHYALVRGKYSSVAEVVDRISRTLETL